MKKNVLKGISVLLLFCLLLGVGSIPSAAAAGNQNLVFEVGKAVAKPGAAWVQIPVKLLHNPGIASVKLRLAFDTTRLVLEKIEYNSAWGGRSMQPQTMKSPVPLVWLDGEKNYMGTDSVFATLTFRVLDHAPLGEAPLTVTYDPENIYNIEEKNLNPTVVNGSVTIAGDQPMENKPVFEVGKAVAEPGEARVQIPVKLLHNPGIASVKLRLAFDTKRLVLEKIEYNPAWGGRSMQPQTMKSPAPLVWIDGEKDYTGTNSVFATLTFRVLDHAPLGEAPLTVTYDPNNIYNIKEVNLNPAVINGSIQVKAPAVMEIVEINPCTDTVTVSIRRAFLDQQKPDFHGKCMTALYDSNGRMITFAEVSVTKNTTTVELPCDLQGKTDLFGQLFLMNQQQIPLTGSETYKIQ